MDVILTADVQKVGARGERVKVAAGYARNYLLPRRLAVLATPGNVRVMEEEQKLAGVRGEKLRHEAEKVAQFLDANQLFTALKIGREGKAFGAVTAADIAVLLRKAGLEVDRRRIQLERPIKRLGVFDIPLAIHSGVATTVRLFVDREGGSREGAIQEQERYEAEIQLAEESAKAEAEARAAREKEAEEAVRVALEKAAARKAREEAEAAARAEKIAQKQAEEAQAPEE
jgi:large subunit ribosomal protein L9